VRSTVAGVAASLEGQTIPRSFTPSCTLTFAGADALPRGHIEVLSPDGVPVCSSRPQTGGRAPSGYAGASWLARARREALFEVPVRDRATGRSVLLATAPVGGHAIVAAFVELQPIAASLAALYGGGRPAEFLITTADGREAISRSVRPARWAGASIRPSALPPPDGGDRRDLDGTARVYDSARVPGLGWRVYVGEERAAALAAGASLRDREYWILLAGVLAVVLAALAIYRRVAVPMKRLATAVRANDPQVATSQVPVAGPTEVAALGSDVNDLIAAFSRELEQRRELQQQLRHAQKMDALGRVVAGVAHDFNNLVTVIGGFTALILRSAGGDQSVRRHAEEAARAAEGARVLIRQLLVFSRKDEIAPAPLDLNVVVGEMRAMLARVIGGRIELVARLAPTPVVVAADRGQLEQVLMNLSVNARDAMPEGGRLTLQTEQGALAGPAASASGLAAGTYASVRVSVTGVGMDATTMERLFEPFFTTKESGKGTGLGLATCYGIVSHLGGKIDVASRPGRGSVFTVYLPLIDAQVEPSPAPLALAPRTGDGETILVVEDDDGLRALTRILLEEAGYVVLDAPAAEEALTTAESHDGRIDLLLTDGVMAQMSGRELARRFARHHPEAAVVHMSGYEHDTLPDGVTVPAHAFLAKPFTPETLLAKLREALDVRSAAP
jgi:signal transduction histidine kinase/ActR/RegA family two-component response regulator